VTSFLIVEIVKVGNEEYDGKQYDKGSCMHA